MIAEGKCIKAIDVIEKVAQSIPLTNYEKGNYQSGGRRFDKIIRFTTLDGVKAGWMQKEKGIWSITEAGKKARSELVDPEDFYKKAVKLHAEWKASQPENIHHQSKRRIALIDAERWFDLWLENYHRLSDKA